MADEVDVFVPLSEFLDQELWPTDAFGSLAGTFLDDIAFEGGEWLVDDVALTRSGFIDLRVVDEVVFDLPFGFALVFGNGPVRVTFEETNEDFIIGVSADLVALRLPRSVFVPAIGTGKTATPDPDPTHFVEIHLPVGVTVNQSGDIAMGFPTFPGEDRMSLFQFLDSAADDELEPLDPEDEPDVDIGPGFQPTQFFIGETGISVQVDDIEIRMSGSDPLPSGALEAGVGDDFRGVYIGTAALFLPPDLSDALPESISITNAFIGTGGFSGTVGVQKTLTGSIAGAEFKFQELDITFVQNALTKFTIKGGLHLPFFNDFIDVTVSLDMNGKVTIRFSEQGGLVTLQKPNVFKFTVDQVTIEILDGILTLKSSGTLTPLFQPPSGAIAWPGVRIEELSIDTKGHVKISGGWIDVPKQLALDLYGFRLEITKVGFGKADDGRNWIGLNGALRLMEGIPAGASVEGLRVLWDDDGNNISLTMNGIGVELEIPGTLKLAGKVALNGKEFSGAVKVDLPAVGMQLEGQFVAGTLDTGQKTFAIFLQMQLPAGIPLGPTGLGIYGFAGLFAHNREPDKKETEGWYRNPDFSDGWFTRSPAGVAQLSKWRGSPGHLGLGAGIILGTMSDNGYMFNGRLLLVLVFPGPVILLEGMANLFTQRASLGSSEPNFHALVVIEPGKSFLAGLDAHYKYKAKGELFDIRGSAEAFFENASNWHIYMGIKDPKERRIRARIFDLFDVNGFFMLTPGQLDIGSGWSYSKNFGFGKLGVGLSASMDQEATISWHPNHFTGSIAVEGRADLHAYGFSTGLSVGATVKGDVFDPFALKGDFKVGINLPWPLPDISKTVTLEWKHDFTQPPALPVPAREASIEHIKSRNTWPLERGKALLADDGAGGAFAFERPGNQPPGSFPQLTPPFSAGQQVPRVPADAKVALTFTRPINDPNFKAVNHNPVNPEAIGDPRPGRASVFTAGYTLQSIELQKWAPVAGSVGSGGLTWVKILEGGNSTTPRLEGAWVPGSENADAGHSEQQKLLLNSLTPFDYTSQRSQAWEQWFLENHPGYPCPLAIDGLSARFEQAIGSQIDSPFNFVAPQPTFSLSFPANYGGQIVEADQVIDSVLGPLDRGLNNGTSITITPPPGVTKMIVRMGTTKVLSAQSSTFDNLETGTCENPFVQRGRTFIGFTGLGANAVQRESNSIVSLGDGSNAIDLGDRIDIPLASLPVMVEVEVEVIAIFGRPHVEVFTVQPNGVENSHRALPVGRTATRFHATTAAPIAKVVVRRTAPGVFVAAVRRVVTRAPATAFGNSSSQLGQGYTEANGRMDIDLPGLVNLIISPSSSDFVLLEMALPASNEDVIRDNVAALSRLAQEDPLFEPENDYRLVVTTTRVDQTKSGSPFSGVIDHSNNFVHHGYFHVVGPPGIGVPDQPPGNQQPGQTGLGDLRLYIEQTVPDTIPPDGGKLLVPRAFYRGYDVAVKFNEPYGELFYLRARRDLSVRLFDVDDAPVRTPDGRVAIPVPSWERSRKASVKESTALWVAMVNGAACHPTDLPPFSQSQVVRDQVLSAPREDILLAPETLHQARLVPALLHETFVDPIPNLIADGGTHRLERWQAFNATAAASHWAIDFETVTGAPGGGSSKVFFVKETTTPGPISTLLYQGALGAADGPDKPANWSDLRASVLLRWSAGTVGLELRRGADRLRVTLERGTTLKRRLRAITSAGDTVLAQDEVTTLPNPGTDVPIVVECVGARVQVFFDGSDVATFDVQTAPVGTGSLGPYVEGATNARFTEIRVDDLRAKPTSAFAFDFVSSKYACFHHHLHSFNDQVADGAPGTALTFNDLSDRQGASISVPGMGGTVPDGFGDITEDERRAYQELEEKALGHAALQSPEEIEIMRVSEPGAPTALLVRSREPFLWERTAVEIGVSALDAVLPIPGNFKLTEVTFGAAAADESITLLVRTGATLAHNRLDWRPIPTPTDPDPAWTTYFEFADDDPALADGTQVKVLAVSPSNAPPRQPGTTQRFAATQPSEEAAHFTAPGVELRVVAPDASVVHQRRFFSSASGRFDLRALRKKDGTAVLLFVSPDSTGLAPTTLSLRWTFKGGIGDQDLRLRRGGSETPEVATLEFVLNPTP